MLSIAGIAGATLAFVNFAAPRMVLYPAPKAGDGEAVLRAAGGSRVWLDVGGAKVESWRLPPLAGGVGAAPLLLFAHGNAERIDDWATAFDEPRREGFAVLLVEYPGYGRSGGSPSEDSIRDTLRAAYDAAAADPTVDPARIVAWGRSLGGGAAAGLSRERPLAALVLESTFTSVPDVAARMGMPTSFLRDRFDNLGAVAAFAGPILVLHGARDELVPVSHARRLHAAAARGTLETLPCGHNDCPWPWEKVRAFLAAQGVGAAAPEAGPPR